MGQFEVERFRQQRSREITESQSRAHKDNRREIVVQVLQRWLHMVFENLPDLAPQFDEARRRQLAEAVADMILAGG